MVHQLSWLMNVQLRDRALGTQGTQANYTGEQCERAIYQILKGRGYQVERKVVICQSIYGTPYEVDFMVHGLRAFADGLAIESKWQQVSGTADQKYPYLVANIVEKFPCPAIVVLAGGGMKPGSIRWLRHQVNGQTNLVGVYRFEEFVAWTMNNL